MIQNFMSTFLLSHIGLCIILKFEYVGIWCHVYHNERKYIPFANELANGIYFLSLGSELSTFKQTIVELVSVNLFAPLPGIKV